MEYLNLLVLTQVRDGNFDSHSKYSPFADAFDYEDAFYSFFEEDYCLDELFHLSLQQGRVVLEGVPALNTDDMVTRWVAWVLFSRFGFGDALCFTVETCWQHEGNFKCFYAVQRDGTVCTKMVSPLDVDD